MKDRIYICHTFYHVYISCLKERLHSQECQASPQAAIVLSLMSTDFGDLKIRLEASGLFSEVFEYDEKRGTFFPALKKYQRNSGNIIFHMINRMIFTKKLGKAQIPFLPTDFHDYQNIYVFCDSDPIGYYLNYAKIPYHAIEDGLNCLVIFDAAHYDNHKYFRFKAWMSARNLIFIQNGYGKYCLDMEVNDISVLENPGPNFVERSREEMVSRLDEKSVAVLLAIFVGDMEKLKRKLAERCHSQPKILILTEPLGDVEVRGELFFKIIDRYGQCKGKEAQIFIKPHPMDIVDYQTLFPDYIVLDGKFPMEILNLIPDLYFDRVISVFTVPSGIKIAGEIISLGRGFEVDPLDPRPLIEKLSEYVEGIFLSNEGK